MSSEGQETSIADSELENNKNDNQDQSAISIVTKSEDDKITISKNMESEKSDTIISQKTSNITDELNTNIESEPKAQSELENKNSNENSATKISNNTENTEIKTESDDTSNLKRKNSDEVHTDNKRTRQSTPTNEVSNSSNVAVKESKQDDDDDGDDEEYYLTVSNLPNTWSYVDIKNYIDTECGPVDEIELLKSPNSGGGSIRLTFQTVSDCIKLMKKLQNKEINGHKLTLSMGMSTPDTDEDQFSVKTWKPDLDPWDIDPAGLYGLKPEFLSSIDITPPLDKWVNVSNFGCDKLELRDVMEMAGQVLICNVHSVANKFAKVMYSHPLEAVQAVSMLNGQTFYGQALQVKMDRSPSVTLILPKGLPNIGPGLGKFGKPLRNVVEHYKRYLNNRSSSINPAHFTNDKSKIKNQIKFEKDTGCSFKVKSVDALEYNVTDGLVKSTNNIEQQNTSRVLNTSQNVTQQNTVQQSQLISYPNAQMQNTVGPRLAPPVPGYNAMPRPGYHGPGFPQAPAPVYGPMPHYGPNAPPNMMPRPGPMNVGPRPLMPGGPRMHPPNSASVQISNLPLTTSFGALCERLSACGQVVSLQLAAPGCAVVRFAHPAHAQSCMQQYNRLLMEGRMVEVKFI